MRYVKARCKQDIDTLTYRFYITSAAQNLSENLAKLVPDGMAMAKSYLEMIQEIENSAPKETRTEEEVIDDITTVLNKL